MRRRISQLVKTVIGRVLFGLRLHRQLLSDKAIIVAFHTIGEAGQKSSINVTPAEFQKYCSFFKRYFDVVPLQELLEDIRSGNDLTGKLAITFDDGYRDNHTYAAVELERFGLPATFFVTTDFINSELTPWWDAEAGIRSEWMSWEEVIDLDRRGFDIGAHTRTHPNLTSSSEEAARLEIFGSKQILESKLGHQVSHFAYPYGKEADISDLSRKLVSDAGFSCCASCFGGITSPNSSPMDLPRIPINDWYSSPFQFGLEATRSLQSPKGEYGEDIKNIPNTLVVSYHMYPDAAVGSRRPSEIMRFLQSSGHRVEGIAASLDARTPKDESLSSRLSGMKVMRVPQPPSVVDWTWDQLKKLLSLPPTPPKLSMPSANKADESSRRQLRETFIGRIRRNYHAMDGLFNAKKQWAVFAACRLAFRRLTKKYSVIISSGPPSAAHLVGYWAAKIHGAVFVVDFRDPWVGNPYMLFQDNSRLCDFLERAAERRCVEAADLVIITTPGIRRMLTERYENKANIEVIYNGFDAVLEDSNKLAHGRMDVLFAGTLYLNRNPFPFLSILKTFVEDRSIDRTKIAVRFVGECGAWQGISVSKWLHENNMEDIVSIHSRVNSIELNEMIRNCAVLLNFAQGQPDQIPAKTFEYLAAKKEMIVVTEADSDTANVVRNIEFAHVVSDEDPNASIQTLVHIYRRLVVDEPVIEPDHQDISFFSRSSQNHIFLEHLKNVLENAGKCVDERDEG